MTVLSQPGAMAEAVRVHCEVRLACHGHSLLTVRVGHEIRSADCGEYREAAGAVAEGVKHQLIKPFVFVPAVFLSSERRA